MDKWRNSLRNIFSSVSVEDDPSRISIDSNIRSSSESVFPKEEIPPGQSSSKVKRETFRRKSDWGATNKLPLRPTASLSPDESVKLRKWSRDQLQFQESETTPNIAVTISVSSEDDDPPIMPGARKSLAVASASPVFGRALSAISTTSGSESECDKLKPSDDDDDSDSDDDSLTPLASRHSISTVTLTPINITESNNDDVHSRLLKLFKDDLERLRYLVTEEMPDIERRQAFIEDVILNKHLKNLRTAVTINTHFFILASLVAQ